MSYIDLNDLGSFASIEALWAAYPEGGQEGDYCTIGSAKYRWDKYDRMWVADPNFGPTPARNVDTFDGDVNMQNNLTVAGYIRAKGIKQPCLGLFLTEAALEAKWPDPEVGMWALVGNEFPATVYVCETNGEWTETEATAGPDDVDLSSIIIYGIKHYIIIDSTSDLPEEPTEEQMSYGYLLTPKLYVYVGTGGDTLNGKYQSVNIGGTPGTNGKSAYQSYLDTTSDNPPLDEEDWVASLKGDQGNSGYSGAAGELEVVNNYSDGGATAALSAEKGKELGEAVFGSGTRTIGIDDLSWTTGKGITNEGAEADATSYRYSEPFALEAGDQLSITVRGSSISVLAKYANGVYTPIIVLPPGSGSSTDYSFTHTIAESGNYVACCYQTYFSMTVESSVQQPGLVDNVDELQKMVYTRTITDVVELEGGGFTLETGTPYVPINTANSYLCQSLLSKFIKFDVSYESITSATLETGESIYVLCFDKDFAYLGYRQDSYTLPSGTKYIKICLTHTSDQAVNRRLQLTAVYHAQKFEYVKNIGNGLDPYYFAFGVEDVQIIQDGSDGQSTYNGDQSRHFDSGYVMLPPNYSVNGDPVPLVIFFHGSGMFIWKGTNATGGAKWQPIYSATAPYINLLKFICKCGYAVCDCSGMSDKYALSGDYGDDFKCAPIGQSCYAGLYNFIIDNFNIRTDGVYAFGKSAGGEPVLQLAYTRNIPLRAIANMNPALSVMQTLRFAGSAQKTNWLLGQFGYVNPQCQNRLAGSGDVAYVKANINNLKGWETFALGTDIDLPTLADAWYKYAMTATSMPDLQAIVDATAKYQPIPMKIWTSEDDENTPYIYMQMYKKMVDNGNGICILRTLPNNTGKHMCTDGSSAVTCSYLTKYGGSVTIPVAFAEMIDWFNRW